MKIVINLKDPDGVWESLKRAGLDPNKGPVVAVEKFISHQEYVSIEIDTDTNTAKVLECL